MRGDARAERRQRPQSFPTSAPASRPRASAAHRSWPRAAGYGERRRRRRPLLPSTGASLRAARAAAAVSAAEGVGGSEEGPFLEARGMIGPAERK
jgi:hypothetical protein